MSKTIDQAVMRWLLEEDQPVVRYRALVDLLDLPEDHPDVVEARSNISKRGWAFDILRRQRPGGHWESSRSLYRPKYTATNWTGLVLSDFGFTKEDERIRKTASMIFDEWMRDEEPNIFHDEVCIVGNTARMLTRFGYGDDPRVGKLFARLVDDQKEDGGWHCFPSSKGTLDGWEALAAFAALPRSRRSRKIMDSIGRGAEFYLERKLYDDRDGEGKYPPWFRFHYPVHYYYDILVGLDLMTGLGYGGDSRLSAALRVLRGKRQKDGTWLMEAVHPDPPDYTWGKDNLRRRVKPFALEQVGRPSKWITLTALRVLKKVEESNAGTG